MASDGLVAGLDRRQLETRLSDVVAANRVTIAVVFPLVGAVLMFGSARALLPAFLVFNPWLVLFGAFVMRLPLATTIAPLLDRRSGAALAVLVGYTYGIELVGVHTGLPYGEFSYGVSLGPMVNGVPLALPLFFVPLVLDAYLLCLAGLGDRAGKLVVRVPAIVGAVIAIDLVLDPAAVGLGLWSFGGGVYYGVPASNYAGWVLSAAVATLLVDLGFDRQALQTRLRTCPFALDDLVSFVLLWGVLAVALGLWVPVVVAGTFGLALARLGRLDLRTEQRDVSE